MRIFLRRIDGEPDGGVRGAAFASFDLDENQTKDRPGRRVRSYWVDVAYDVHVVPVDWRWFASDVDFINRAIALCVKDNFTPFASEPRTLLGGSKRC